MLGLYQSRASQSGVRLVSGDQSEAFILIFGDSNCIDGAHLIKPCYWLVYAMLDYTSANYLPQVRNIIIIISSCFPSQIIRDNFSPGLKPSELLSSRLADNQLHRYSRVLQSNLGNY